MTDATPATAADCTPIDRVREPLWLRVTSLLLVAYCIVLLGVFVKWEAALIGCLIAVSAAVARG